MDWPRLSQAGKDSRKDVALDFKAMGSRAVRELLSVQPRRAGCDKHA